MTDGVPGEPKGEPTITHGQFEVYAFDADASAVVPDIHIVDKPDTPGEPYIRQWIAVGYGPFLAYRGLAEHKYGPDDDPEDPSDCCSWDPEGDIPDAVERLFHRVSDAPMVIPTTDDDADDDGGVD